MEQVNKVSKNKYAKIKGSEKLYLVLGINKNTITLKYSNIKVKVLIDEVILLDEVDIKDDKSINKTNIILKNRIISDELMLRHLTVYEAIDTLDRYINEVFLNKKTIVRIIHGKSGTKIKEAVYEYLKNSPFVIKYELSSIYDGNSGVTIVYIGRKSK